MTICALWTDGESIHALADTVTTRRGTPSARATSMGQYSMAEGWQFEEDCCKVTNLASRVLVTGAGDADRLRRFTDRLRDELLRGLRPRAALEATASSFRNSAFAFSALTGYFEDGQPVLQRLDFPGAAITVGQCLVAGNLASPVTQLMGRILIGQRAWGIPSGLALAFASCSLTTVEVQENLLDHGIGGVFFGGSLSEAGFSWQPHTAYFVNSSDILRYWFDESPTLEEITAPQDIGGHAQAKVQRGCLLIQSNLTTVRTGIYMNDEESSGVTEEELDDMLHSVDSTEAECFCFISKTSPMAVMVDARLNRGRNWLFTLDKGVGDAFVLGFSETLAGLVKHALEAPSCPQPIPPIVSLLNGDVPDSPVYMAVPGIPPGRLRGYPRQ